MYTMAGTGSGSGPSGMRPARLAAIFRTAMAARRRVQWGSAGERAAASDRTGASPRLERR